MADVRVLVLRAAGINCDEETMHCWRLAGAKPVLLHVNVVAARPAILDDYQIVTIPGGFSFGDDIAAGRILAQRLRDDLGDPLGRLVDRGGGLLGICNGFQVLVKMGLLPDRDGPRDRVTITDNDSARFEARWVRLEVCTDRCPFLTPFFPDAPPPADSSPRPPTGEPIRVKPANDANGPTSSIDLEMPVEHAEGKVVTADDTVLRRLEETGRVALRYVDANGRSDTYPANPNGSVGGIAGLCDPTGRILGLMPHPDRHFHPTHHPLWTRRQAHGIPDGLRLFRNATVYWSR